MTRTDGYYNKIDGKYRQTAQITMSQFGDIWYAEHFYQMDARGFWERRDGVEALEIRTNSWARAVEMLTEAVARGGYHHSSEIKSGGVL
jgi:hypothetical protein